MWGHIAEIPEGKSENAETPFEFIVIGRIPIFGDYYDLSKDKFGKEGIKENDPYLTKVRSQERKGG